MVPSRVHAPAVRRIDSWTLASSVNAFAVAKSANPTMMLRPDSRHVDGLVPIDVGIPVAAVPGDVPGIRAAWKRRRAGEHQVLEEVSEALAVRIFVGRTNVVPDLRRDHGHACVGIDGHQEAVVEALGDVLRCGLGCPLSGNRPRRDGDQRDDHTGHEGPRPTDGHTHNRLCASKWPVNNATASRDAANETYHAAKGYDTDRRFPASTGRPCAALDAPRPSLVR